jgi:hypothetical protein
MNLYLHIKRASFSILHSFRNTYAVTSCTYIQLVNNKQVLQILISMQMLMDARSKFNDNKDERGKVDHFF